MACQICFENDALIASNADIGGALCRRSCAAQVCISCLARHVEVSLTGFYAGVLPLIRCPICLLPMRLDRWTQPLTAKSTALTLSTLLATYETLCKQALSLRTPCCDESDYTHLPVYDSTAKKLDQVDVDPELVPPETIEFHELIARFCGHHVDAQDVIAYTVDRVEKNDVQALMERTLPRIADSERRARLLLAFLYKFPNMETRCCNSKMCFNCKRVGHHDRCEEFDKAVDESQCLVRCRECHVLLMKVEGCDSVTCVCGFYMSWIEEVRLQIEKARQREQARRERLNAWIQTYKPLLSSSARRWMWRMRLAKALADIERACMWRAYYLLHPEEKLSVQEEEAAFFMIDV